MFLALSYPQIILEKVQFSPVQCCLLSGNLNEMDMDMDINMGHIKHKIEIETWKSVSNSKSIRSQIKWHTANGSNGKLINVIGHYMDGDLVTTYIYLMKESSSSSSSINFWMMTFTYTYQVLIYKRKLNLISVVK